MAKINWEKGFKRIILLIAIGASIRGGACMVVPIRKYCNAQNQPWVSDPIVVQKPSEQEVKEFEKWIQEMAAKGTIIDANYYVIDKDDETHSLEQSLPSLKEIRPLLLKDANVLFWRNLSKPKLIGICILTSLTGAFVAFFSVWLVFWFGGLAIYRILKWVVLGFCDKGTRS
ncbi:MAG: hypothetical protein WAK60_10475 [Sedimentisphaerales bacterium]